MSKYQLESALGILSLNGIAETGRGIQVQPGVTGMGMPPLLTQWSEGAGHGGTYRGTRVRPRDLDFPLHILANDHDHLMAMISEFALHVTGGCRLRWIEPSGASWWLDVNLVGGGSFLYGRDTIGKRELNTVVTFRAGDPFWTGSTSQTVVVDSSGVAVDDFVTDFVNLPLSPSQTFGDITLTNEGDAPAYPVWSIRGPGDFIATHPDGRSFEYATALETDETLAIDAKRASVLVYTDGNPTPVNGYANMSTAPKFWTIPPGTITASVEMTGTDANSSITVTWNPRRWVVI